MQRAQGFSADNHPFSIAVLTSPNRRGGSGATGGGSGTAGVKGVPLMPTPPKGGPLTPTTPTAPTSFFSNPDGPALVPHPSPMSSTGSADCSPDTSFSSVSSLVFSPPDLAHHQLLPVPSPAASEDSGRGSPFTPDVSLSNPGSRAGTPDSAATRPPSASAESQSATGSVGPSSSEKPPHSYIALISMAILGSSERKLVLADIYQYIMDTFPYYNNQERAWRNSIRHNLSLNECFIKAGRADNGKGNYWAIHPACVDDFSNGDFRRRQARRRARSSANFDQMAAAAMALRCSNYVPMTTSTVGPYGHPYLPTGMPGLPAYLSPAAAAYASMYPAALASPAPPHPVTTMPGQPHPQVATTTSDAQGPTQHGPSSFASPAHALMAAYGTLCGGARSIVTSGHMTHAPSTPNSGSSSGATPYSQHRYTPYGRIPTQLLW